MRGTMRSMTRHFRSSMAFPFVIPLVAAMAACTAVSEPPAATPAAPPGRTVDAATAGSIAGKVTFTGTPPSAERLRVASDPACVQGDGPNPISDAVLVGDGGALRNVFVHVKSGVDPSYTFAMPADPVVLDQHGCRYAPRVLGIRVGQALEIRNSDSTFHNVHALPKVNQEFNEGQQVKGQRSTRIFTAPEVMVRFKCDVHGWMAAWVGVLNHPFFAVTGADGSFTLAGVPPGTYTVEAWHERFGTRAAEVTVGDRQAAAVSFAFAAN
jgi:plastocyanin